MNELKHCYSDDLYDKRIVILGPIPPPLGGVSVHVQRVIAKLKMQRCAIFHFNTCVEYRYHSAYIYLLYVGLLLFFRRPTQVHLHTLYLSNGLRELALIIRLKRLLTFDIVLIEHDCRYLYTRSFAWKQKLNQLMSHIAQQVYIGDRTAQSFSGNGIVPAQKTTVEAAFLPPNVSDEQKILATYPHTLFSFLNRHTKNLLANAWALSLLEGKDLYGFDLCIKVLSALRKQSSDVGLIFVLGQIGDKEYFNVCMHMIHSLCLQDHIFILTGQKELWPLMKRVDVFLRPTLSDGASVSVQEAMWHNVPVVASDVCWRPKEVMLFKTGDTNDLLRVLYSLIMQSPTNNASLNRNLH